MIVDFYYRPNIACYAFCIEKWLFLFLYWQTIGLCFSDSFLQVFKEWRIYHLIKLFWYSERYFLWWVTLNTFFQDSETVFPWFFCIKCIIVFTGIEWHCACWISLLLSTASVLLNLWFHLSATNRFGYIPDLCFCSASTLLLICLNEWVFLNMLWIYNWANYCWLGDWLTFSKQVQPHSACLFLAPLFKVQWLTIVNAAD